MKRIFYANQRNCWEQQTRIKS